MTIKGLKKYLQDKYSHIFKSVSMYKFKGCKIAIDVSGLAYAYWSPQQAAVVKSSHNIFEDLAVNQDPKSSEIVRQIETNWLNSIWSLIKKLLLINITPVMVFDGTPPKEKGDVIKQRQSDKKDKKDKIDAYVADLLKLHPLMRTAEHMAKLKEMYTYYNLLSSDQFSLLKLFFNGLGLPVLQAKNEAEELCCTLCREGYVSAVFCEDVDCVAHLAPCWIYAKSKKKTLVKERNEYMEDFEFVLLKDILKVLKFTPETLIDFCIMCGCDYNSNIPNFAVASSFKALSQLNSIEAMMKSSKHSNKNFGILNYEECRNLFAKRSYAQCCDKIDNELIIDKSCISSYAEDYLFKCNMSHAIEVIKFVYDGMPDSIKINFEESPFADVTEIKTVTLNLEGLPSSAIVENEIKTLTLDMSKLII